MMRIIIISVVFGIALGFSGCTQKEEATDHDQDGVVEYNSEDVDEGEAQDVDEKHVDDPADILQDLTF